MKFYLLCLLSGLLISTSSKSQTPDVLKMKNLDTLKTESHIKGLKIALLHRNADAKSGKTPVLFIHGSSFPSSLSFGFNMCGYSWMDELAQNGIESFALDFLGYGNSDRYPQMNNQKSTGMPVGRAIDVYKDIDLAVNVVLKETGAAKVDLIAHSWGGSVAMLYASKYPEKIKKLVLYAPMIAGHDRNTLKPLGIIYNEMTPDERVRQMRELTPTRFAPSLLPEIGNIWKQKWLQSDPIATTNSRRGVVRFPSGPDQDIDDLTQGKAYYDPALIKVPVLIIRGEWDTYSSNDAAGELFSKLVNAPSKKYVVIEKGTHVIHLEKNRDKLYQEVLNFLAGDGAANPGSQVAVIFEVIPQAGEKQEYLDIAAKLKPTLMKMDGFISIERFQSLTNPDKILSLSFWRDEKAIQQWRNVEMHRDAQAKGRDYIFKDYHLRIAAVVRNYGMFDRAEAPSDSRAYHDKNEQ